MLAQSTQGGHSIFLHIMIILTFKKPKKNFLTSTIKSFINWGKGTYLLKIRMVNIEVFTQK